MKSAIQFIQHFSWPFGLCGGTYTIVRLFVPEASVSIQVLLAFATVMLALVLTLVGYVVRDVREPEMKLRVTDIRDSGTTLILAKNDALAAGMGVQVYLMNGSYEELIGTGAHLHTQTDGAHQVRMEYNPRVTPETLGQVVGNSEVIRKSLIVKPGVLIARPDGER